MAAFAPNFWARTLWKPLCARLNIVFALPFKSRARDAFRLSFSVHTYLLYMYTELVRAPAKRIRIASDALQMMCNKWSFDDESPLVLSLCTIELLCPADICTDWRATYIPYSTQKRWFAIRHFDYSIKCWAILNQPEGRWLLRLNIPQRTSPGLLKFLGELSI